MKTEKMIRNKFTKIQVVTLDGGCFVLIFFFLFL